MGRRIATCAVFGLMLAGCGDGETPLAALAAVAADPTPAAGATPAPAPLELELSDNPVLDWNALALRVTFGAPGDPPREARAMAILQRAVLGAVASAPAGAAGAAVAAAAHDVMVALYPARTPDLDAAFDTATGGIPANDRDAAVSAGRAAARAALDLRRDDHSEPAAASPAPVDAAAGPGTWRPAPPASAPALEPGWARVTPFVLGRGDRFRPPAPYALTSAAYAADLAEIAAVGSATSTTRTADQTETALFWRASATQEWNALARSLAETDRLSVPATARLLLELDTAEADAAIAAWDAKFTYRQWRPVTGIREAGADANPDTIAVADWTPLLPTPPFPDYACGHTVLGGAAQVVLERWFGADPRPGLSLSSPALPGVSRHWPTFAAIGDEVVNARVWGGIHWRTSCVVGRELGEQVGSYVLARSTAARGPHAP